MLGLRNGTIKESLQLSLSGVSESSLEDLMSLGLEVATIIEVKNVYVNVIHYLHTV